MDQTVPGNRCRAGNFRNSVRSWSRVSEWSPLAVSDSDAPRHWDSSIGHLPEKVQGFQEPLER